MKKKDKVYYARIIPNSDIFDICELTIRTIGDTWFVGIDKYDKHAYLLNNEDIGKIVFVNRNDALDMVKLAERNKPKETKQTNYEGQIEEIEYD